jgi:hypothetical protein
MGVKTIIGTGIGILIIAILIPIGFDNIYAAETTGWDTAVCALFFIIPLAVIVYFITKYLLRAAKSGKE